ncbi:hypothetical protein AMC83_CH02701 [Rhizobium phaseoli]|nr:hypothetical protein AMC83_CH02701 [Rhizobium phaseoli]
MTFFKTVLHFECRGDCLRNLEKFAARLFLIAAMIQIYVPGRDFFFATFRMFKIVQTMVRNNENYSRHGPRAFRHPL